MKKRILPENLNIALTLFFITLFIASANSQIPTGYYNTATGTGATLKTNLYNIIKGHTQQSYDNLYDAFKTTDDVNNAGIYVWDMYSDIPGSTPEPYLYQFVSTDQCGTYDSEADCYNREHSMPSSWFNDAAPMYTDLFQLYPTDGYVNNRRSNYPFGTVGTASWTSLNGSKLGNCSYPGYTGTVFEPINEYKGDFARTYFYLATRYENVIAGWYSNSTEGNAVLQNNSFPVFETWFLNMLGEWCVADPVSQKEIDRNNAVYAIQGNRNPYIDHPEYIYSVWGVGAITTNAPTVTTPTSANVTNTTATLGGNITSTGSTNITESGIYYSQTDGFADGVGTKVTGTATSTGAFTVEVNGLTAATDYYFKAFATNSGGTTYSSQGSFVTTNTATPQIVAGKVVNSGAELDYGTVTASTDKTLYVKTNDITGDLTVAVTGAMFSASTATISQAAAGTGYTLTITYNPTAAGAHTGTLTISGGGLNPAYTVNLKGNR